MECGTVLTKSFDTPFENDENSILMCKLVKINNDNPSFKQWYYLKPEQYYVNIPFQRIKERKEINTIFMF